MKNLEQEVMNDLMDVESRRVTRGTYLINRVSGNQSPKESVNYPDARKHQLISFIKSGIRILGYILIPFNLFWAAGILVLSEVVGIIEELV